MYAGWATREGDFLPFELLVKMYYDCHRDGLFYKITVRKRFHERRSLVNTSPGSLQIQNAASGRSAERRLISVSIRTFVARRWLDINSFLLEMTAFRVIVQPRIKALLYPDRSPQDTGIQEFSHSKDYSTIPTPPPLRANFLFIPT